MKASFQSRSGRRCRLKAVTSHHEESVCVAHGRAPGAHMHQACLDADVCTSADFPNEWEVAVNAFTVSENAGE